MDTSSLRLRMWPSTPAAPVAWLLPLAPCALRPSDVHLSSCARRANVGHATWRSVACTTPLTCTIIDTAREPPRTPRLASQFTLSPHESLPTLARSPLCLCGWTGQRTRRTVSYVASNGPLCLCSIVHAMSAFLLQLSQLRLSLAIVPKASSFFPPLRPSPSCPEGVPLPPPTRPLALSRILNRNFNSIN